MPNQIQKSTTSLKKKQMLSDSILAKWKKQNYVFIRFIDGHKHNLKSDNLEYVSLNDVLQHRNYICDWDLHLNKQERALLQDESWVSGLHVTRVETPTSQTSSHPASA